jgi:hypothetical protein
MKTTVSTSTLQRFNASTIQPIGAILAAALLAGCASKMAPSQNAYVYIAANTAITFDGETFMQVDELPRRLIKAGATPQNTIILIPQGEVPAVYIRSLVNACGRGGLPNVVIREQVDPTSATQKLGTGLPKQPGATPPRFVAPGAKGKPVIDAKIKKQ